MNTPETQLFLGLDTSCYTTSVALCRSDAADGVFLQQRRLLTVPEGARGLSQSDMVFQHATRLPELIEALFDMQRAEWPDARLCGIAVSARPRPAADSYMPAFRVGEGYARSLAAAMNLPFVRTTHQQGHLRAARVGTDLRGNTPFLAVHLSGGTTEVLQADAETCILLGGTRDLHAGQLIDRIGVRLGLGFPAGAQLEALAARGQAQGRLKTSVSELSCHFSGAEAEALRWIEAGGLPPEDVAAEVFACVARTVSRLIVKAAAETGINEVLLGGGVASSYIIRAQIIERVAARRRAMRLHFARPDLAGDNAVGVALIGMEQQRSD
ncbi:MAG: O-sialoglycoprotein endopeptidase [Oscillospiraceae bacterium]|jgi:N6-L-threonylcarbamoyladenine synthase|nr:O-sialoglycoprotein endopeptidase [Oscillospiraceae bacterium]